MKLTIDIAAILSPDLTSRSAVSDLSLFIRNTNKKSVIINFVNVKFVTRSFIDEFYNSFLKDKNSDIKVKLTNVPADIQMVLDAVSKTQHKTKNVEEKNNVITFSNFDEVKNYLKMLPI